MAREDVTVAAKATFHYDGREIRPGQRVTMRPLEAAAAHRLGYVSLTRGTAAPSKPTKPKPAAARPTAPAARRYKRRDLEPEP